MGVTKKATVVAKLATKKRGRPAGSKNKSTNALSSEGWVPPVVDWEKLSKQLQKALAAQIREADQYKRMFEDMEKNSKPISMLSFWDRVKIVFTGKY